jgi:demethylmenaquinone methyltransferase/2-methoxy-6-polyprenyl-1,4-benzoquinol methylase
MEAYYERRSAEYDDWYLGTGLFAERERPGWEQELSSLIVAIRELPPARTLDVACGTGFVTRHLPGDVIGLDRSPSMLAETRRRVDAPLVLADAFALPLRDHSLERIFTGHFYGHLVEERRQPFLDEVRRVAGELVVLDAALREDVEPDQIQERVLSDGSVHRVYKRFFEPDRLADEIGGEVVFAGRWFLVVRAVR